jgi:V8-like Glu-specific endopeptidase
MAFVRVVADVRIVFPDGSRETMERKNAELATGSAFVIAPSGLLLTSLHVVEEEPPPKGPSGVEAEVTLENRRVEVAIGPGGASGVFETYVAASDVENDLAALQVTAGELPYLPLGDSDAAKAGQAVRVLGFPFGRKVEVGKRAGADVVPEVSVTAGSLSAARANEEGDTRFLQTDASINPGNSGGPMLDEEGYVVGVVRMKLARDATSQGAGFAVPVNVVKDFLDASGLSAQLPVTRLRPGVLHTFDWKGLRVELPDGFSDVSPSRLVVDAGQVGEVSFRADRLATPLALDALQAALLEGKALPGFVPAAATVEREATTGERSGPPVRTGTAFGTTAAGERFRVEFAIVDRKQERIAARFVGPADAVAFNLGLVRRSLRSLAAEPMLIGLRPAPISFDPRKPPFERVGFPQGESGRVPVPTGWVVEPASRGACRSLPAAAAGLAASHPSDYTLVLRALRWSGPGLARAVLACPGALAAAAGEGAGPSYSRRFERLGVDVTARAVAVERPGESLLLEVEAPTAKLVIVEGLFDRWVEGVKRGE